MSYKLVELNENMFKEIYEMYQDIPTGENGQTNDAYGLSEDEFKEYIVKQIKRKNNEVTYDDTPTITYIMFVNERPVGFICLRTKIDDNWKKWSGNFYYQVRVSDRRKGYATKMLSLGLKELQKLGFSEVYGQSSKGNIGSAKVIENNGGIFINEVNGTRYYKIILNNIYLKTPSVDELNYREQWMNDPKTMEYNAGYDINLKGYDKNTGIIKKTKEEMKDWYYKWINKEPNKFFAYIYDKNIQEPVGETYYYLDDNIYNVGILIEAKYRGKGYAKAGLKLLCDYAKKNGIKELYDDFEANRNGVKVFEELGFKIIDRYNTKKFDKDIEMVVVKKIL